MVVRECEQQGIDFEETFSPVVNSSSLRTLLVIATKRRKCIIKFDIKTAFLYGDLDTEIFMKLPERFDDSDKICKLNKTLYGLKQAPLKWNALPLFLRAKGLKLTKAKPYSYRIEN